jgi:hypothetical protein
MKKSVVLAVMLLLGVKAICHADEGSEALANKLAEKGIITYGEAQTLVTESQEEARKNLANASIVTLPAWIQNISMSGDLRLRSQSDWNSANFYERVRDRVRLRMNLDTRLSECYKAGFGFATGSESIDSTTDELGNATVGKGNVIDANSGSANSTFSGFGRLPVELNLAFIEYDPAIPNVTTAITVGKMRQGTQVWNATDLLWESSLNPDGAAISMNYKINGQMTVGLIASLLSINNLNSAVSNPTASIGEVTYTWDTDDYKVKLGVAQQNLDVYGKNCGTYFGDSAGVPLMLNATGGAIAGAYIDYFVMSESFELTWKNAFCANNIAVVGDMAANSFSPNAPATISDENASCYGVKIGAGSVAGFGQWQLVYLSRTLGGNAWLNKLGANDPYGAAHNETGSQEQINLGLSKALTVAFTYYDYDLLEKTAAQKVAGNTKQDIFQADLIYKF